MKDPLPTLKTAQKLGLSKEEFKKIKKILGRTPNFTELSIFSVMWSEHCSYKNSIVWLKKLPKDSPRMLVKAGEENAGLVDIGDGLACSFKIESHNHPSAIEPYQGAATGVGGINRDIFTMGARPIAQLNSLRFGNIGDEKTKWLVKGIVKGIGDYGNAFGIPTVGGEVYFDECYNTNPLVNAFSAGIVEVDKVASAIAYGVGNPVFIVGSATGKDGIHGATFASEEISKDSSEKLPAVQVGDPFQEKLLLEATLEVIATDYLIGIQDMGAAGITCSTSEMSAKGKHGMNIWLDKVPTRQPNMKPFEILLSESQERMLIVIKKGKEAEVKSIFDKWDLNCDQIGVVTDSKYLKYYMDSRLVADVPADDLVLGGGAPVYHREYKEPEYFTKHKKFKIDEINLPTDYKKIAGFLLSHPNIASRAWIYEQYDSMVGTNNTSTNAPSDAAVIRIKGTEKAIVITVDCNARYVHADPEKGCAIAVAEAARNIVCSGGEPIAITNCLNFGNPYNPEVFWQFTSAIKGMIKACEKFNTPVTGGNVSFYNQSENGAVFPTPVIGMLGLLDHISNKMTLNFKNKGDLIYLVGKSRNCICCSEYLYSYINEEKSLKWLQVAEGSDFPRTLETIKDFATTIRKKFSKIQKKYRKIGSSAPYFDLDEEYRVQNAVKELIKNKLLRSAHDVSDGGLYITLVESAMHNDLGFDISTDLSRNSRDKNFRKDAFLFGESQSRIVVSVSPLLEDKFLSHLESLKTPYSKLGRVISENCIIDGENFHTISEAKTIYENALPDYLD